MRAYAIGDVHGHLDKLEAAHALITEDRARCGDTDAPVVHVGDLVDRGPDSKGVIQFLIDGQDRGENWVTLMGNHDRMAALFLQDRPLYDTYIRHNWTWFHDQIGGQETLESYGVVFNERLRTKALHADALARVPESHRQFLFNMPSMYQMGQLCFVHAGIRPGVPLDEQDEEDLVWIRQEFHASNDDHGALIIHGHTPIDEVTHYGNRVNLDTGAAFGRALSAVVIEGRDVWLLGPNGRQDVRRENLGWG